jgi:hypothetical protein
VTFEDVALNVTTKSYDEQVRSEFDCSDCDAPLVLIVESAPRCGRCRYVGGESTPTRRRRDMSDDETPREYDHEFRRPLPGPLQTRVAFDRETDRITRFVVQLEYHHGGEWHPVVRYDHDGTGESEHSHDVSEDGLHIDIYRDGNNYRTEYVAPALSGAVALDRAEDHLQNNLEGFTNRYEQWHGIRDQ